ncbi:MAG: exodeoxyribonuclease VII small subunit [Clostridia bacterium]|nr:exodeoxyribonuclease VII small subunit [Clostridia bacterium]
MSEKKTEKSFEEMLKRLEEIVKALDAVDTPLDECLALFEEGAGLVKSCTARLDEAQQKVNVLTRGADGAVTEASFQAEG